MPYLSNERSPEASYGGVSATKQHKFSLGMETSRGWQSKMSNFQASHESLRFGLQVSPAMFWGHYCRQDGRCVLSSGCAIRSPQLRVSTPSHHRCCYVLLPSSSTQELRHTHSQVRPSDTCVLALLSQLSAELVLQPTVRQSHRGDTPQTLKAPTILSPNICNSDFPWLVLLRWLPCCILLQTISGGIPSCRRGMNRKAISRLWKL